MLCGRHLGRERTPFLSRSNPVRRIQRATFQEPVRCLPRREFTSVGTSKNLLEPYAGEQPTSTRPCDWQRGGGSAPLPLTTCLGLLRRPCAVSWVVPHSLPTSRKCRADWLRLSFVTTRQRSPPA